jgi:heptosyltransferase-2
VVLTLPLIQSLARLHGPVDVVVTPAAAPLLNGQPSIGRVIPFDKRGADRGIAGMRRLASSLQANRYARAFIPHRSLRSALIARLAGIPQRTGFAGGLASWWHTHRVARPDTGHESQRLLGLVDPGASAAPPWLALVSDSAEVVERWMRQRKLTAPFVVLAPGARWATKRWPWFAQLAASLPHPVVVIGGLEDQAEAERIVATAPGRIHNAAGDLSLSQSAAMIARSALVVSNDSVALHLAVALGRPVIAVVGPTGPAPGFAPLPPDGTIVAHPDLACRPCSPHGHTRCPLGHHRCMRELEVEVVRAAVSQRMGRLVG